MDKNQKSDRAGHGLSPILNKPVGKTTLLSTGEWDNGAVIQTGTGPSHITQGLLLL